MFHLSGKVNRQNVRIWDTKNSLFIVEHARNSFEVNMFCAMSKVYGHFFFMYGLKKQSLAILTAWLMNQVEENMLNVVFQQDVVLFHISTWMHLNDV